ncbi:MAG: hypothetical protein ACQGVC_07365 [Myxococcota bacterium]
MRLTRRPGRLRARLRDAWRTTLQAARRKGPLRLAAFAALAIAVVLLLLFPFQQPPVYVEIDATVSQARIWLTQDAEEWDDGESLLPADLRVVQAEWRGLRAIDAGAEIEEPDEARLQLRSQQSFRLDVALDGGAELRIVTDGPRRVDLIFENPQGGTFPLRSNVRWSEGLELRSEGLPLPEGWGEFADVGWVAAAPDRPRMRLEGLGAVPRLGFELATGGGPEERAIWVVDPAGLETGARLGLDVPTATLPLSVGDRLVFVETDQGDDASRLVLRRNLVAEDVRFWQPVYDDAESYVVGGRIRFPGRERGDIDVPRDFLLDLEPMDSLRLRQVAVREEGLAIQIAGTVRDLRLGPGIEYLRSLAPSRLLTWYSRGELNWLVGYILVPVLVAFVGLGPLARPAAEEADEEP